MSENTKIKERESQLHSMGFSKKMFGFSFQNFSVNNYQIEYMHELDWDVFMNHVQEIISKIKKTLAADTSDKHKLEVFAVILSDITGPEVREKASQEIVDNVMHVLGELRSFIISEVKNMPNVPAAD